MPGEGLHRVCSGAFPTVSAHDRSRNPRGLFFARHSCCSWGYTHVTSHLSAAWQPLGVDFEHPNFGRGDANFRLYQEAVDIVFLVSVYNQVGLYAIQTRLSLVLASFLVTSLLETCLFQKRWQ